MFQRDWRLTRRKDFQRLYRQGATIGSRWLFVRYVPNTLDHPRIAVVIGKKVAKKAVVRNRLKRLVREATAELIASSQKNTKRDLLITIHRDPGLPYDLAHVKSEVTACFAKLP